MNVRTRMLAAWAAAIIAALLLTLLPFRDGSGGDAGREVAVFKPESAGRMNNRNLVDLIAGLELSQRISRVGWSNSVLSVDLVVPAGSDYSALWFRDVFKLVNLSFHQVGNVSRLLVRCSELPPDSPAGSASRQADPSAAAAAAGKLLFSADVRKADAWLKEEREAPLYIDPVQNSEWGGRLRLHLTSEWNARFRASSLQ